MLVSCPMDGNGPFARTFPVDGNTVSAALALVRTFAEAMDIPAGRAAKLSIIVEELLRNVVEHGGARGEVTIVLDETVEGTHLALVDNGAPFDPRRFAIPAVIPARGGGAGIALVRAWATILEYLPSPAGNRVRLLLPR